LSQITPKFDVLGRPILGEGPPNVRLNFINMGHHWPRGKVW